MDVIKLLLTAEKKQGICFLCFIENVNGLNIDDGIEICDEISRYSTSMRTITNDLFPSYDILSGHSCEICTKLMIEMYTTINRAMNTITLIQQLSEKISIESDSKSLLVRNKMTINLKENVSAKECAQNQELVFNKKTEINMEAESICDVCGKTFKRHNLLKIHLKSHTETKCSSSYTIDNKKLPRRNVSSMFNCNECDYKTVNKQDIKSHINKKHLNLRPYVCKICHKGFFNSKNLKEHCLIHERVKNMVCDICGERFSYRKTLEFHMKSHVNDRPFPCIVCGHRFVSVSQRNEHVKRKHGPKDFVCDLCDSKYSLRKELKRHVKNIHKFVIHKKIWRHRSIPKSPLRIKLQNILISDKICSVCFECENGVNIDDELEIVSDGWSCLLRVGEVYRSVFHESTEELVGSIICNNCIDELVQTYIFIQNSKFTADLLQIYVNDLATKTKDLVTCFKDTELESNIVIVLENEENLISKEISSTAEKTKENILPNGNKINEIQEKNQCKVCFKRFLSPQYLIVHYKTHLKAKCNICGLILPETKLKSHLKKHREVLQCSRCSEVFCSSSDLENHCYITHNVKKEKLQCVMCLISIDIGQVHNCTFKCPECNNPSCKHFAYLIHFRDQGLLKSQTKCLNCDYVCTTKQDLIDHVNICHINTYNCDKCYQNFGSNNDLESHICTHDFKCDFCEVNVMNKQLLEEHIYICKGIKSCRKCPANFNTIEELEKHEIINHNGRIHNINNEKIKIESGMKFKIARDKKKAETCAICQGNFDTKEELKQHIKHAFRCKICNTEYDSLRKLSAHNHRHINPFSKCYVCDKNIKDTLLEKHIESHGIVTCNKCDKTFENITLLKYHQKSHLNNVQCTKCNLMVNPAKLRRHLRSHDLDNDPQLKESRKQKPNVQCELCDYITWNSILLECHKNRYHLKIKPYVCHICSKNFIGKHLLKKHIKTHTVDRSVICTFCGKKLANSSCLNSHLKIHTGEKNYPCDICGEKFRSSSIMNVHKVKKHSERDAACPLCPSKFYNLVELRRHVVKIHWKKESKFDPRELKGLENHYHLFHDGRRIRMDDQDVDFYLPCS